MDRDAVFKISYGLYVLTANEKGKDNGCIINTAQLVTDTPMQITVTVNKTNYTHGMIQRTGVFALNILSVEAPMKVFEHFGFKEGSPQGVDMNFDCIGCPEYNNGCSKKPMYIDIR
jgi:flavin reductase (DIM6/NTAB) family NADH-FMN oxidoreductase RutF